MKKEKNDSDVVVGSVVAMLSGTRNHHQSDLAQRLYDRMKSLFPEHKFYLISASILLSNTYSSIGDYQQADEVRTKRIEQVGNKVKPGLTWTEVNGELVVNDSILQVTIHMDDRILLVDFVISGVSSS